MFGRLGKFLKTALGVIFFWVGWAIAVLVLTQAIILSVATGNPAIPVLLGLVGIGVWLLAAGFRSILAGR